MADTAGSAIDILLDEDGFLVSANAWNPAVGRMLGIRFGVQTLSEDHWKILWYIRRHYLEHGSLPSISHVCKRNDLDIETVNTLFPHGCLQAWRIAGLPYPGEEAKTYMQNESPD